MPDATASHGHFALNKLQSSPHKYPKMDPTNRKRVKDFVDKLEQSFQSPPAKRIKF